MAKNQARVGIGINFNVNQQSLNNVKKALSDLKKMSQKEIEASGGRILNISKMSMHSDKNNLGDMRKELEKLEKAFEAAYNPKLGTYELNKFNASLKESGTSAQQAFAVVAAHGQKGQAALLDMTTNMLAVDRAAKQVNDTMKKLGDTMMNTLRWTITSTAINTVTGAIQQAYHYALDLDQSLNDIRIVTGKSADDMNKFAREANKAAKALGASTTDYTEASLIYYQQGLSDKDVKARTDTTIKTAAVTGQSASAVSEQLTAVWNGYKVSAAESEKYIDKLAAVAASTAADLEELSTGMSKVASAANVMGVDIDQLNAQLATIVSVTREAPESVGTALKTVYARMSDIEAGLDTETTLGEYTSQMAAMGINVLDANGKLRDMGAVVEEIGNKWTTLNREQQVSLAQSIAGTRQYSRMMALFDNWDMYQDAMTTSMTSAGTLAQQHATYLESIEAHQEKLKTSAEGLYDSIFNSDDIKRVYDLLSGIVTVVDQLVQTLGGMPGILSLAGVLFTKIAKSQIADLSVQRQKNKLAKEANELQIKHGKEIIEAFTTDNKLELTDEMRATLDLEKQLYDAAKGLNDEEWAKSQQLVRETNAGLQESIRLENELKKISEEKNEINRALTEGVTQEIDGKTYYYDSNKPADSKHGSADDLAKKGDSLRKEIAGREAKLANGEYKDSAKQAKTIATLKNKLKLIDQELEKTQRMPKLKADIEKREEAITKQKEQQALLDRQNAERMQKTKEELALKQKANALADLTSALSILNFSLTMVGSSVSSLAEGFIKADTSVQSFLQGITGGLTSLASMAVGLYKTVKAVKAVKAANVGGAVAWTAYWAAATMGLSVLITLISTVVDVITSINGAISEKRKAAIEDANATLDEAKANQKLIDSYLELYEIYSENHEVTEDLKKAAEELIEQYGLQGYAIDLLCGDYDALAEAAQNARDEEQKRIDLANKTKKENAGEQLDEKIKGVGRNKDTGSFKMRGKIDIDDNDNATALRKVQKALSEVGIAASVNDQNRLIFDTDGSDEEAALLYSTLSDVYHDLPSSDIKTKIKKLLDDESFSSGATAYREAAQDLVKSEIAQTMADTNYDEMDSANFEQERQSFIKRVMDAGFSEEEARNIVDKQYAEEGGAAYQKSLREQYIEKLQRDGLKDESKISGLRSAYDNMTDAEFAALQSFRVQDIDKMDIAELTVKVREKALENQEAYWASLSTQRLKALNSELEKYEKITEKAYGKEKVQAINDQNANLEKQKAIFEQVADVAKRTSDEATQNTLDLLSEEDIGANSALYQAIQAGNWEEAARIVQSEEESPIADLDVRQQILTSINTSMEAQNKYNEAIADAVEAEEKQLQLRLDHIDAIKDQYDTEIGYLNDINEMMNNHIELLELFGKKSKDTLKYYETIRENSAAVYRTQYQELLEFQAEYKRLSEIDTSQMSEAELQSHRATFDKIKENYREAAAAAQESLTQAVNDAITYYQQETAMLVDNFTNKLFGASFDRFEDEVRWATGEGDVALDATNREYQMRDLRYQYQSIINSTTDLKIRKQLEDIQQREMEYLESRDNLTEKDFERAKQVLEIEKARLALEEARSSKTQMRLTRGADGTYSYQYVADDNAISEAQKALEDAQNSLYNFNKEDIQSAANQYFTIWTETIDKINEYAEGGWTDDEKKYAADLIQNAIVAGDIAAETILRATGMSESEIMQSPYAVLFEAAKKGSEISIEEINALLESLDTNGEALNAYLKDLGIEDASNILWTAADDMYGELNKAAGEAATLSDNTSDAYENAKKAAGAYRALAESAAMAAHIDSQTTPGQIVESVRATYASMDTGGYTGDWGTSAGKLAILHEKEIVLNKEDTANILRAVDLVRALNTSMFSQIATLSNSSGAVTTNWNTNSNTVAQTVEIKAEFPNVTDRGEIEEAFDNLVNLAAQHAFRTTIE